MRGVVLAGCLGATVVDLTHGVQPGEIEQGAFFLAQGYTAFPPGSVHVAVVDPGVGTARRCLVASANGHYFVGPDNGVLTHAWGETAVAIAVEVECVLPEPGCRTFHGRDVFAPLAARIANGSDLTEWGPLVEDYVRLPSLDPELLEPRRWRGRVLNIDRFGNVVTSLPAELATGEFSLSVGDLIVSRLATTYGEVDNKQPFAIVGSAGFLEISVRGESAADAAGIELGAEVILVGDQLS